GATNAGSPRGNRVVISRESKQACVTLQRSPPEIRTLERNCAPFSSTVTSASGRASAQVMAAKNPAAPPPTTMTRCADIVGRVADRQRKHSARWGERHREPLNSLAGLRTRKAFKTARRDALSGCERRAFVRKSSRG